MGRELGVLLRSEGSLHGESAIGDLARIYDISLRTLRFYEDKGLLQPRRQGTARYYSARDRIRLELILKGKRLGFTLAEIFDLIASRAQATPEVESSDLTAGLGREQIATQIAHLQQQRRDLDQAIGELHDALARLAEPVA